MVIVFSLAVGLLVTNTNRTFGSLNEIDETLLQTLSKVYALMNGILRIGWGILYDKVNFRILYCIIIVNYIVCIFSYYFCGQNGIAFFIVNCMTAISFSGNSTLFGPIVIHYFGIKNSIILSGFYYYVNGVVGLISPIICKFFVKNPSDFLIIYIIGGCFSITSFISFCFMKRDAYNYTWKSKSEQEEEIRNGKKEIGKIPNNQLIGDLVADGVLFNNDEDEDEYSEPLIQE